MGKEFPNGPGLHVTESVCSWSTSVQHHWEPRSAPPLGSLNLRISDHSQRWLAQFPTPVPWVTSQPEPGLCAFSPLVHTVWKGWPGWHASYHLLTASVSNPTSLFTGCPGKCCQLLQRPLGHLELSLMPACSPGTPLPPPRNYLQSPSWLVVPSGVRRCAVRITQRATSHSTVLSYSVYFPHYTCLPSLFVWLLWVLYLTDFYKPHAQHMQHNSA